MHGTHNSHNNLEVEMKKTGYFKTYNRALTVKTSIRRDIYID